LVRQFFHDPGASDSAGHADDEAVNREWTFCRSELLDGRHQLRRAEPSGPLALERKACAVRCQSDDIKAVLRLASVSIKLSMA